MTRPLTVTRPCVTISSASRREASPARASTLAMRSPDFLRLRLGARRALVEIRRALAIGAAAAEGRALCKDLAVVLVVAARPIVARFAARMLLPVGAAFGPSWRGRSNFGPILARTRKARAFFAARGRRASDQIAACRNCARRRGRDGNRARRDPRASATAWNHRDPDHDRPVAKIPARAPIVAVALAIRSATRELLVAAKFSLRPITTGTVAIARRSGAIGPIATRTIAVFAKTFATRRIGPLLAATLPRRIGLPVAKFPVGETSSRTGVVAITARARRSSRLKFGRSPRGVYGRLSPPRSSRGLNERFSPSPPREDGQQRAGRRAGAARRQNPGAADDRRPGGVKRPSRLPA